MKIPGPDHPIDITDVSAKVRVIFNGKTVAESTRALAMQETDYPVVHYIPRDDVDMSLLTPTDHGSHCPYKGDASYFTIEADGESADNAVWYYDDPYPAVSEIKDYVAFYKTRVDSIDVG
jgi:uncharacterized protein (DUF427 family)